MAGASSSAMIAAPRALFFPRRVKLTCVSLIMCVSNLINNSNRHIRNRYTQPKGGTGLQESRTGRKHQYTHLVHTTQSAISRTR